MKTAAESALAGDHPAVVQFLETGRHVGLADDYRVEILTLSSTGAEGRRL